MKRAFSVLLLALLSTVPVITQAVPQWADRSPHKSGFVTVNGVKLHYLDWGGKGETLLFLHGLGDSAHIFDDIAPKFTDHFRVLALTRRGHGLSDKPETGYETSTLVEDIRQFLDALKIKRVSLVGHSMADKEMTLFAGLYPRRVKKLVYLDAAYDRSGLAEVQSKNPLPPPRPAKEDLASFGAYRRWWEKYRGFWSDAVESNLRETSLAPDGTIKPSVAGPVAQAILKGANTPPMDYTRVQAPALSFYAIYGMPRWLPPDMSGELRQKVETHLVESRLPFQRKNIERFRKEVKNGRVVEVKDSDHYVFVVSQDEVVREMRKFLLYK
jgi:pimeloyl-ACP methyl ester carboxylesterase